MLYTYRCEKCDEITDVEMPMMAEHPKSVECPKCHTQAKRYFGTVKVHVPESFKATSELYNQDTAANFDYISNRMKHGTRMSGKEKIYY